VSLRQAIARPQEPVLFHRSLSENIAYGRPQVLRRNPKAASLAHADIFIDRLPKPIAQRSASAASSFRAASGKGGDCPRDPCRDPYSCLDEATSSLDSVSEALIRDAIAHLSPGARRSLLRTGSRRCKASIASRV